MILYLNVETMKKLLFITLSIGVIVFSLCSCGGKGSGKSILQAVSGSTNELLVILPKDQWNGPIGDTIKQFFAQPQVGLPQTEPIFDLLNLPPSNFERTVKSHRNILIVSVNGKADSANMTFFDSPWAKSQKIFKIVAPNEAAFYKIFDEKKEKIMGVYIKAERDRMIDVYKKTADNKIFNTFKNKYKMLLYCPGGYVINKDLNDFVWISSETRVDSKGIIFFQEPYENASQLDYHIVLDRVNEELKEYIPGPRDSTWMALDMVTPMTAANYDFDGKYYALLVKGLWIAENDFMGGPFVLNVVLDQKNNRIIYMMGYVYAPDGKKRNMLRQVESILYSMQIDFPEEEKK